MDPAAHILDDPPESESDFVDLEAPRTPRSVKREGWTLTIADERDGRLSTPAAEWLSDQLSSRLVVDDSIGRHAETPLRPAVVKVRIQRNVRTGEVFLRPAIEADAITVRTHRGARDPLPRRFYVTRLIRAGLVKPKQVVRLRVVGDRLLLVGVKAPI